MTGSMEPKCNVESIGSRARRFVAALDDADRVTVYTLNAIEEWDVSVFHPSDVKCALKMSHLASNSGFLDPKEMEKYQHHRPGCLFKRVSLVECSCVRQNMLETIQILKHTIEHLGKHVATHEKSESQ